jgi:hypothetical protein
MRFILRARPPPNFNFKHHPYMNTPHISNHKSNYYHYEESNITQKHQIIENEDEKIEWEKVNVEDIASNDEIKFQSVPKEKNEEKKDPLGLPNIPQENLIPMNINTLFDQNEENILNDMDKERLLTDDFSIDQEIEKLRKNISDGNTNQINNNNLNIYNSNEVVNNDIVKEGVNLKPFFTNKVDDKIDNDEEIDVPSLFADLTLFSKTQSTPNKRQNTLDDISNNYHFCMNSLNDIKHHNPLLTKQTAMNPPFKNTGNNDFNNNLMTNNIPFYNMPQVLNNRQEIEGKLPQNMAANTKRNMNKFNISNSNLKAGLMINTNENVLNQHSMPPTFLTPNNTNFNLLSITPKQNDQMNSHPLTPQYNINNRKIPNLDNPIHIILKNIPVKGWRINDGLNTIRMFNSHELYTFLENEILEGKNISTYCINDVDHDILFIPNFLYECLKENYLLIKEKMTQNMPRSPYYMNPGQSQRKNFVNKYSSLENFSTSSTQASQPPLLLNKMYSHDTMMNMNKFNKVPISSSNLMNTNQNMMSDPLLFLKNSGKTYMPSFNAKGSISPLKTHPNELNIENQSRSNYINQLPYNVRPVFNSISPVNDMNKNQYPINQVRPSNFNFNVNFVNSELSINNIILNADEKNEQISMPFFSPENKKSILNGVYFNNNDVNEKSPEFCQRQIEKMTPLKNIKNKYSATYEKSKNVTYNIENK